MTYVVCMTCRIRMSFDKSDVLMKWDQHDVITDYTRYAKAEIHSCKLCGHQIVLFKSVEERDMVYHKDLGEYPKGWKIVDTHWSYK